MTDNKTPETSGNETQATEQAPAQAMFRMVSQYIQDLSVECLTPAALLKDQQHELELQVGVQTNPVEGHDNLFTTTVILSGTGRAEGKNLFVVESEYTGMFQAENIPANQLKAVLSIDGASLVFPFARQVFQTAIQECGYRPPLLEPINFGAMFQQAQQQAAAQAEQLAKEPAAGAA